MLICIPNISAVRGNVVFETLHDFLSIFLNESKKMYLCTAVHLLKRTRPSGKVHVCNCPTSAEKSGNFSAEVGEVLWSVFLSSRKEVIFVSYLVCKTEKNDFVFNKLKFLLEKFVCVDEFRNFGQTFV